LNIDTWKTRNKTMRKFLILIGATVMLWATPISLGQTLLTVDRAEARIGRPLSPGSVAGVHRRTYRRAAYGAAAVGAVGYGAYRYGSAYGYGHRGYGYGAASPYYGYRRHCRCY
jgi:hypothetical protein